MEPTYDDLKIGVKVYDDRKQQKNMNSNDDYHMISNLSNQQMKDRVNYDGITREAETMKTSNQVAVEYMSERRKFKDEQKNQRRTERPMPMRSELVENYFSNIMSETGGDTGPMHDVFGEIYKHAMDNRIFNNLKQQLNELIEDEKSLISIPDFKRMFAMYFKAEVKADIIYTKLLPFITVYHINGDVYEEVPKDM